MMVVTCARKRLMLKMVLSHASVATLIRTHSKEGEDDPKAFPLVLDELLARTMVLRVKVQPSYNQSSVIRLYEDPNLIKKVLDQIGVFEVFFLIFIIFMN
ncbi:hypothetical protein Lalb_Chr25g0284011 [Lupinus albus]|uniref:Uncharacterized protein n=1 Tax=Lupinus albus TaxID=3870 RepID=A0A6A4MYZ8_LUPAL|nr:hypothetical protein Lalb_Chr25g0284011 [Lupinus albus]